MKMRKDREGTSSELEVQRCSEEEEEWSCRGNKNNILGNTYIFTDIYYL